MAIQKGPSGALGTSIEAGEIATGAVTADKLGAGAVTVDKLGAGAVTAAKVESNIALPGTTATINGYTPTASNMAGRNKIINGNMVIDQRNAGAIVTPTNAQFITDRWQTALTQASKYSAQQNAGSVTPPAGFINYLGITSLSAYSVISSDVFMIRQAIEGLNVSDLDWGSANAKTVTLSFWVRSSLTGTFGGALTNSDGTRSYPFSYTISAANTFEQKTITIAGDTSGTWLKTNGVGVFLNFGLGVGTTYSGTAGAWAGSALYSATGATSVVGTSGATFYITGVQLEAGSSATEFEYRQYGTELALCQRYFENVKFGATCGARWSTSDWTGYVSFCVTKRATPTVTITGQFQTWVNATSGTSTTSTTWAIGTTGMGIRGYGGGTDAAATIFGQGSSVIFASSEL